MGRKLITYPTEVTRFWGNYRKQSRLPADTRWEAWPFGDNPRLADELLKLVLEGKKRGTVDLLIEYENRGERVPEVGDHSVILDGRGKPAAIIRTARIEIKPFMEVPAEFAYSEGEDDRTLESWRREHRKYFARVLSARGVKFDESSLVVMESFDLVYRSSS
jgi:uncharacterized protein YhfF